MITNDNPSYKLTTLYNTVIEDMDNTVVLFNLIGERKSPEQAEYFSQTPSEVIHTFNYIPVPLTV
jgi:hypothetical protein